MFSNEIMLKSSMTTLSKHDTSLIRFIFDILNEENIKKHKTKSQNKWKYGKHPPFIIY